MPFVLCLILVFYFATTASSACAFLSRLFVCFLLCFVFDLRVCVSVFGAAIHCFRPELGCVEEGALCSLNLVCGVEG